jgi:large subunit ribosomal protein L5
MEVKVEQEKSIQSDVNPMRGIMVDKVVINMGIGQSGEKLKRAQNLLEQLTGQRPTITYSEKTIKNFGIRKGEAIGVKVTLRREKAEKFLRDALTVKENKLRRRQVNAGEFSFGIHEHIDLPGVNYDPDVGIFGMDVNVSLRRRGFRVSRRRICKSKVGKDHLITKEETIDFLRAFGVEVE